MLRALELWYEADMSRVNSSRENPCPKRVLYQSGPGAFSPFTAITASFISKAEGIAINVSLFSGVMIGHKAYRTVSSLSPGSVE